ncbi:hypothetical protein NHX12_019502 [Muraenolepis orangiensis]|uniref:inositol-3-phosphate synthase n=1 Tax=Muraenolepis orangiensis TaxID=630683 RepID=A0A9Q0ETG1_9TELE|nr:hypothetical protein NHX12_019502 [Muraenolepis orangiensis]
MSSILVDSPNVRYSETHIESQYSYHSTAVRTDGGTITVTPSTNELTFRTERRVPRVGVMLAGWGGNNGSTVTAAVLANKLGLTWTTKTGEKRANYYGSLLQASTVCLGMAPQGEVHVPFRDLLPMVHPDDIIFDGWDISSMDLGRAMQRAKVLNWSLQEKLRPYMSSMKPRPSIYIPEFIAANQDSRADNVLSGTLAEQVEQLRADIRDFKQSSGVDKVIVLWTANTERFCEVAVGLNDTAANLLATIQFLPGCEETSRRAGGEVTLAFEESLGWVIRGRAGGEVTLAFEESLGWCGHGEVSPSTLFAVASIQEGCAYINGSPQNTFVPGAVELAVQRGVFIGGDDFKSGQTKMKSVLVDFLVSAGIKPTSIVSYNHLGNNDGMNLSAPEQFRSKEISKSNVVDDMVVIKYVPYVGDSKRAMDEYSSEIMMGGTNTIAIHNTCEGEQDFQSFHSVLALLAFFCKAPLMPPGAPLVNAFFRQRAAIENILRACLGLPPQSHMHLEHKLQTGFLPRPVGPAHNGPANGSKAAAAAIHKGKPLPATNGNGVNGEGLDNDVEI